MVQLPSSVLRYWESVFEQLKPEKTSGGTRKYTMQDVEVILKIKDLLYAKRYTIAGAKAELQQNIPVAVRKDDPVLYDLIVKELESIINDIEQSGKIHEIKKKQ